MSEPTIPPWPRVVVYFAMATVVWAVGIHVAGEYYPRGFKWTHTVISALASRKHNPEGAAWFAGAITVAMASLWPAITYLTRGGDGSALTRPRGWVEGALRIGAIFGTLVGVERLLFYHFSTVIKKGHELMALIAFLALYAGVLGLYAHRVRVQRSSRWPALLAVLPLMAVGLRELFLYFAQRHLGWADYDWYARDTPLWLSFAWWQWLAAFLLWAAVGHLLISARPKEK